MNVRNIYGWFRIHMVFISISRGTDRHTLMGLIPFELVGKQIPTNCKFEQWLQSVVEAFLRRPRPVSINFYHFNLSLIFQKKIISFCVSTIPMTHLKIIQIQLGNPIQSFILKYNYVNFMCAYRLSVASYCELC